MPENQTSNSAPNVKEVVPFLRVSNIERSLRYYLDGLGFAMANKWEVDGKVRWCWLTKGGASLMLQEGRASSTRPEKLGQGISLNFTCEDTVALYHEFKARGIQASEPQVLNALWEIGLTDPDGFRLFFESPTDTPEETWLSQVKGHPDH